MSEVIFEDLKWYITPVETDSLNERKKGRKKDGLSAESRKGYHLKGADFSHGDWVGRKARSV